MLFYESIDKFYKILSVFFFFVFTDTADHTEFFQSRRALDSQLMQGLVRQGIVSRYGL